MWEPYRLVDADGLAVEPVAAYLRDLQAADRSAATARSYALDLLRWFRFLWVVEVSWDRATRVEARDFCRWLQVAGKPVRPHWRQGNEPATTDARPGGGSSPRPYAASVRAHSETVLRSFYEFHLDAGTGPMVNPFPLDRARRTQRAHAHQNPMDPARHERSGLYRPTVPARVPRSVPDEQFNEIFARLPSVCRASRVLNDERCSAPRAESAPTPATEPRDDHPHQDHEKSGQGAPFLVQTPTSASVC